MLFEEMWEKVLDNIRLDINKQSFDLWLKDTFPLSLSDKILYVGVSDNVAKKHISDNYSSHIESILKDLTKQNFSCEFITQCEKKKEEVTETTEITEAAVIKDSYSSQSGMSLNPGYTFDNFVVGPNNEFAHAAAKAVIGNPGKAKQFNPLFLYGGTGLGKTHLMQAIGNHIAVEKPYLKVLYVSSETFVNEFIQSIQNRTINSFKIKYRNVDLLLIDDIQFIEQKEQTQEEFFHTFNMLYHNNKQLVICSDRPPKELSSLQERLITRFQWGLITDIQPPNLETREAILRNKAKFIGMDIPDDVLSYIARRIKGDIRALEAALSSLNLASSLNNGKAMDIQLVNKHLRHLFDDKANKNISPSEIIVKVSEVFGITAEDIVSKHRHNRLIKPRFIAMYLATKLTELTTTDIGRAFGKRDHSTVLNARNNVEKLIEEDEDIRELIEEITFNLRS